MASLFKQEGAGDSMLMQGFHLGSAPHIPGSPGWGTRASVDAMFNTQPASSNRSSAHDIVSSDMTQTNTGEVHIRIPEAEFVKKKTLLDRSQTTKVFLVIVAQIAVTLSTLRSISTGSGNKSFSSPHANILLDFAKVCNVTAFICFLYAIFVCDRLNPGVAASILSGIGYVATTYGLLAVMCMELLDKLELQLWITAVVFIVCIPALAAGFRT